MTRDEKIQFIIKSVKEFEDVTLTPDYFKDMACDELDKRVDFMEYLWEKYKPVRRDRKMSRLFLFQSLRNQNLDKLHFNKKIISLKYEKIQKR